MKAHLGGAVLAVLLSAGGALGQTDSGTAPNFATEQSRSEWSAQIFLGDNVVNDAGETIGNVNDLLFDSSGRISTAVIGVGGVLGIGEKTVAVPFSSLSFSTTPEGERVVKLPVTKEALNTAPDFKLIEKSTLTKAQEKATEMGKKAMDKAGELKDEAVKKIDEMRKDKSAATEPGETSDRTPEKKTETPPSQQDSVGGETSDRTPGK